LLESITKQSQPNTKAAKMKPAINALLGYSYQNAVARLLVAKMDVEREIEKIEIEPKINNKFDDMMITLKSEKIYFQIKDIDDVALSDLIINENSINIKSKDYSLSKCINLLIFKKIGITNNSEILGIPAYIYKGVYIVSLTREDIENKIESLYRLNSKRIPVMFSFFEKILDNRKLIINQEDLPTIDLFNINLIEKTIQLSIDHLKVERFLLIEGKPGIGKSHLVNILLNKYPNKLIYRFWISNQDKDQKERLIYNRFLLNLSKELFNDPKFRSEEEIIQRIVDTNKTVIIDGLDHVENYNEEEIEAFVTFVEILRSKNCNLIIFSRPLRIQLNWKKIVLENWTKDQTTRVLDELFHIKEYNTISEIYKLTNGYPILVRYIAEHFKRFAKFPDSSFSADIGSFYYSLTKEVRIKSALFLFLTSKTFFMKSEISDLLEESEIVDEFIQTYPYLFEIRLNRISLFHDSFNTYLKNQNVENIKMKEKVNRFVYDSIMSGNRRFLSRFLYFDLGYYMKLDILKKYSSLDSFQILLADAIDYESITSFYSQLRESLEICEPNNLSIANYYDLALILNIANRDQVSTVLGFFYTYVNSLIFHGFSEENITSSEYLFSMLYYVKTKENSLLYNLNSNNYNNTTGFLNELSLKVESEENFFDQHQNAVNIEESLPEIIEKNPGHDNITEIVSYLIVNAYIHNIRNQHLDELSRIFKKYLKGRDDEAHSELELFLSFTKAPSAYTRIILIKAKETLKSLGFLEDFEGYRNLTLQDFIKEFKHVGSFQLREDILSYFRLALHEGRKIDITSISAFWFMYSYRKDYSIINISVALFTFEQKGLITELESLNIIISSQKMSEKGVRHILNEYIELHKPGILKVILENFDFTDLQIQWFQLPANFINFFPTEIFNYATKYELNYHSYSKIIKFDEIKNVFLSDFCEYFAQILNKYQYKLEVDQLNPFLEKLNIKLILSKNSGQHSSTSESVLDRFNAGILYPEDVNFIKSKNLSAAEVASFSDGNYSVFSNLELFKAFGTDEIKNNIRLVFYNAILAKIKNINMFATLYFMLGNLPKFLVEYKTDHDIKEIYYSFRKYLKISLLTEE